MHNPFKDPIRRRQFDDTVASYRRGREVTGHLKRGETVLRSESFLFDRNGHRAGNAFAAAFWAGYDGLTSGARVPAKGWPSWSIYAAGKAVRKAEEKK